MVLVISRTTLFIRNRHLLFPSLECLRSFSNSALRAHYTRTKYIGSCSIILNLKFQSQFSKGTDLILLIQWAIFSTNKYWTLYFFFPDSNQFFNSLPPVVVQFYSVLTFPRVSTDPTGQGLSPTFRSQLQLGGQGCLHFCLVSFKLGIPMTPPSASVIH